MIHYLHDIRNKLSLISTHANILSSKYGTPEDFTPIHTNVMRINELVNEAYNHFSGVSTSPKHTKTDIGDFLKQIDLIVDALKLCYLIEIKNEVLEYRPPKHFFINYSITDLIQIMENAIGNSINANANTVYVRTLNVDNEFVLELVDDGNGKSRKPQKFDHPTWHRN
jgi:signal transduction histidine kinase